MTGIRKFASAVIDFFHHQARLNQKILKNHPEIQEEYDRDIQGVKNYGNVTDFKKSFDNMFVFSNKKMKEYKLFSDIAKEDESN